MMSNEPTDVTREGDSGSGGEVISTPKSTESTLEKVIKVSESYANVMNSVHTFR